MTTDETIRSALAVLSSRGKVFTTSDIVSFADLKGQEETIRNALSKTESLVSLSIDNGEISKSQSYLLKSSIETWWFESMPRWASKDLDYVTSEQLARTISFVFNGTTWRTLDEVLLSYGRKLVMVADGCISGTYVFPWAVFLRNHPHLIPLYREYNSRHLMEILHYGSMEREISALLHSLDNRDSIVIQKRFGLGGHVRSTLEEIGIKFSITRERVRQIENRAMESLRNPRSIRRAFRGFAAGFMQGNGSLLARGPYYVLLSEILDFKMTSIEPLGVTMLADKADTTSYLRAFSNRSAYLESLSNEEEHSSLTEMPFLTVNDYQELRIIEQQILTNRLSGLSRPEMLYVILRQLGRAAHYTELAVKCNALFPERQNSIHNWHAALGTTGAESLGIVYVGKHGTYGLTEHGYSKPAEGLYDSIARIVATKNQETGRPVSLDTIVAELSKERKEINLPSVPMVLHFSEQIESIGGGYIPAYRSEDQTSPSPQQYDIDAAFKAFSSSADC